VKKFLILLLLFPSLAFGYETKSGTITVPETWVSGETYVLTASVNISTTVTVEAGAIIKFEQSTIMRTITFTANDAQMLSDGTPDNWIYTTDCRDNTIGADTSAECITGYGSPDTTYGHQFSFGNTTPITVQTRLQGFYHRYCGYATGACINSSSGRQVNLIIDQNYFDDTNTKGRAYFSFVDGAGLGEAIRNELTISNSYFDLTGASTTYGGVYVTNDADNASFTHVLNNIFVNGTGIRIDTRIAGTSVIKYNTIDCNNVASTIGIKDSNNIYADIYYNIISNCPTNITASGNSRNNYNITYNGTTNWNSGANNSTSDPVYGTHDDTYAESLFDERHLGALSPAIDMADISASSVGLDTSHTEISGVFDSGALDIGFHFYGGGASGGMNPISKFFPISLNPIIGTGGMVIP